jgi:biotin synthase-like enzyme
MTYIPSQDKPSEFEAMWGAIQKLRRCETSGKWDAEGLVKWLKTELLPMEEALERLDEHYEQLHPGAEYEKEVVAAEMQRELVWSTKQIIDRESGAA